MTLTSHLAVLAAVDLRDLFQGLIVILFIFAPVAKRIFEGARKAGTTPRPTPPGRRPPTRPAGGPAGRTFSWEDLMSGRVPEQEPVASAPEDKPAHVDVESRAFDDLGASRQESTLAEFPIEDEVEVTGGDDASRGSLSGEMQEFSAGEKVLVEAREPLGEDSMGFKIWEEGAVATIAHRSLWRPRRGEWRRALVMSELITVPATMRREGSFPGPPLGLL